MSHTYEFARPALTVDIVVFALDEEDLQVMLIQRDLTPFEGQWALPGGFVRVDETLDNAARRVATIRANVLLATCGDTLRQVWRSARRDTWP